MQIPTAEQKAYMAGFFDGEGTIAVSAEQGRGAIQLSVFQNKPEALQLFQTFYGGAIAKIRAAHYWQSSREMHGQFLADMFPYLIVKKERASLALQLIPRIPKRNQHKRNGKTGKAPLDVVRLELCKQIKELNRKNPEWRAA